MLFDIFFIDWEFSFQYVCLKPTLILIKGIGKNVVCLLAFELKKNEQAHIPHAPTLLENAAYYAYYNYEG